MLQNPGNFNLSEYHNLETVWRFIVGKKIMVLRKVYKKARKYRLLIRIILREAYEKARKYRLSIYITVIFAVALVLIALLLRYLVFMYPVNQISQYGITNATEKANLVNQYRTTSIQFIAILAQILGGIAVGIGIYFAWGNLITAKESQITERFTRAIDQLGATDKDGNPAIEIRLGGIYALERIANESKTDYWSIIEILTTYVRKNSPIEDKNVNDVEFEAPKKLSLDIQAILTVIRRCRPSLNTNEADYFSDEKECFVIYDSEYLIENASYIVEASSYLDFHDTYLWNANLFGAHFEEANFEGANLSESNLSYAKLKGARLINVNLKKANLSEAKLDGSFLIDAHLEEADFYRASLKYTFLTGANLKDAKFHNANLELTFLLGANLEGADFRDANLKKATLSEANLKRASLTRASLERTNLKKANLEGADLYNTNFQGAYLEGANLKGAKNLTINQLSKVFSLYNAKLDEKLEIPLRDNHRELFDKPDKREFLSLFNKTNS